MVVLTKMAVKSCDCQHLSEDVTNRDGGQVI